MIALTALDIWILAIAPFVGSFLSEAARVWPAWSNVGAARSTCAPCGKTLTLQELAPIASYVAQRSRCRCGARRLPLIHPVGDATFIAVVALAVVFGDGFETLYLIAAGALLLFAALVDARTMLLPDACALGLMICGLSARAFAGVDNVIDGLAGAGLGFAALTVVNLVFRQLRGRDGLGGGDAKLFAAGGALVGAAALPVVLATAAAASLIVVAALGLARRDGKVDRLPFGPSLAAAIFATLLWQSHAQPWPF